MVSGRHSRIACRDGRLARLAAIGLPLGLALVLSGCAALGLAKGPPPTFDLTAPRQFPGHTGPARGLLVVAEPSTIALFDTEKIVVRQAADEVATLAGAQWSDRLPKLVQARLIQGFENANRVRAVGRPDDRLSTDFLLISTIRAFDIAVGGAPHAEVEIAVKIVADRRGRILAGKIFRATVPTASTEGAAAAAALDQAFQKAATDIVLWAARLI